MRFRPANISLINRRHYLPRLLLTLSSFEKNDQRILTGHYISLPDGRPGVTFRIDVLTLKSLVTHPIAGAGTESAGSITRVGKLTVLQ
jgi:hypothetical protein